MTSPAKPEPCVLENAHLRVDVAPDRGASVMRLDYLGNDGVPIPVLRAATTDKTTTNVLPMFMMVPWCNRISGEGLPFEGTVYPLPRLIPEQVQPIHGTVLHRTWQVREQAPQRVALTLREDGPPPFNFEAEIIYSLDGATFRADLTVRHRGDAPAPYGAGFHPWLAREPGDRLSFAASAYVEENEQRLPTGRLVAMAGSAQDFTTPQPLPDGLINNTFVGWDGTARLDRSDGLRVTLGGEGVTKNLLHVYSRTLDGGFVCLEPMSHTVDCANHPVEGGAGLTTLAPGEAIAATVTLHTEPRG